MKRLALLAGIVLSLLMFACGLDNTMYNARKYFAQAQARPLNSNGKPNPQAVEEYTKTIQKCGMVLTEKKEGKKASEALFLLAKALYYKGNSAFQAKDQFEALISGFPHSRHVPEAYIYLARVLRQLNRAQDSEKLLEGFVRDGRYQKYHPHALMVLAEFEIGDEDYLRAQYWLQRIIEDYPKTPQYKEAFFLFGKNYYQQKDYRASYREFDKLLNTRGISKELKLEARYYMALNLFEMDELDKSLRMVNSLLNAESRPEKLSLVRVLKSRLMLEGSTPQKGIEEVDDIAKTHPRSASSASAYYYLGDYYFYRMGDLANATTSYNKVRSEFPSSELVSLSQQKATALNQISQNKSLNAKANLQQYVDYHMLAADNYLNAFSLADSTLLMYDRILQTAAPMRTELDSLQISFDSLEAEADSLQQEIAKLQELLPPEAEKTEEPPAFEQDTSNPDTDIEDNPEQTKPSDEEPNEADTQIYQEEHPENDDQKPAGKPVIDDIDAQEQESPASPDPDDKTEITQEKTPQEESPEKSVVKDLAALNKTFNEIKLQQSSLQTKIKDLQGNLTRFDTEIIPLVSFAKASLLYKMQDKQEQIQDLLSDLEQDYPDNKYTNALKMLIAGQKVRFVDAEEDRQAELLDHALGMYPAEADSMRSILQELSQSTYPQIELKANFRLGWLYTFDEPDTTQAKAYLNSVLDHPSGGEYASFARKFFNGTSFHFPKDKPDSVAVADSLLAQPEANSQKNDNSEELAAPDTVETITPTATNMQIDIEDAADEESGFVAEPDDENAASESLETPDSLPSDEALLPGQEPEPEYDPAKTEASPEDLELE